MNELARELNNLQPTRRIKSIQFGLFNPEEIRTSSVCEVTKPDTFDGTEPVINGLFDPRMGVIERGPECATCENNNAMCPGHFGHIELTLPVFHMHFIHIVMKLLPCVCFRCSNLLVKKTNKKLLKDVKGKTGENRFKEIYKASTKTQKASKCCHNEGCRVIQPAKYTLLTSDKMRGMEKKIPGLEKGTVVAVVAEFKEEAIRDIQIPRKHRITPEQCYEIFRRITDEDCLFLGFNPVFSRPEWMICTVLPVPPPSVRPSVQRDNNQRSEDDLTYVLLSIIKANNQLRKKIDQQEEQRKLDAAYELLQWNVATLISNKIPGIPQNVQRSGKVIKALRERITGKNARIRGNLLGKRVDFSARTVISVDPNISIDEFGMPKKIAMILTYPEIVTEQNFEEMEQIVRNGPNIHPGAKKIERLEFDCFGTPSPCTINLKHVDPNSVKLKIGDVIHRHIKDGDVCLFNRQPSLHRMSMMGHKAIIVENNTFRLNVFVCSPYNADFDGDEMNTFIPESAQTRVEIEELAGVPRQIITPATSTPIISVAQDSMVGSYLMTKSKFATTGEQLFHYMMPIIQLKSNFNFIKAREKETWTGNELYSMILPNISLKNSKVEIKNGDIVEGFMNKATLGGSSKGIIQAIMNQHGTRVCRDFLDNLQRLVVTWMEDVGFSIGFGDMMPKKNIRNDILKVLNEKRIEANELIRKSQMGLFEPYLSNEHKNAKLEMDIGNIASRAANEVEQIVFDNLPEDNNFIISIKSGTKGKEYNLKQVIGTFGQQNIDGRRLAYGLSGRVLPHYTKWDRSLESRGFVFSSYMNGLTPQEFFYISMGSRSDAIDSNIKTAETGYVQRRLIKALEDLTVEYDGTVRDSTGNIVQMSYGRDGYDSIKLEHVPIKIIKRNDAEMETIYQWSVDDISEAVLTEDAYEKLMKEKKENETALLKEWNQLLKDRSDLRYKHFPHLIKEVETVLAPVNMKRLIYQMRNQFQIEENDQSDLTPIEVIELVSDLVDYVSHYNINKGFSPILKILLRSNLSSKQCIFEHRLPGSILTHLIDVIKHKILYAIVNPGEMVGVIAAQSIGEPLTQMTLNTFHFSGLGAKAVLTTSGVPRIQEIINMSKEIKTPSMTIYFKPQYAGNKEIAFEVKNQIEYTEIKDLLLTSEIIYLPDKSKGKFEEEEEQFRVFQEIAELTDTQCPSVDSLSNWVLWMEFDREMMVRKNIYMSDIQEEIVKNCNVDTDIHCVVSNMNSKHLTLRIRVTRSLEEGEGYISFFRHLADCLGTVSLRGIPDIRDVQPDEVKRIDYEPDGTMKSVDEWVLRTNGSNLIAVLSNDYVDVVRTTTNDITEIRSLFGIEGTRNAIIRELNNTIYEGASKVVNNRHYSILADLMTYRGKVMQIQRNGFGKSPYIGPLGRATYEVMDKVLVTAGIFAEEDDMEGTSSNIIAGQGVKAGTNAFDLYINKNLLPTSKQEQNTLFPPEQNVSDRPEANFSPAITPLEAPENFVFDDDFREKMNSSKEVRLEDYIQAISAQTIAADDNDFNFGYGISGMEEHVLPETNIGNIEISIVKSDNNVRNRRRRKR
jgi:DNA-directed RNA polymerase II subunit RPB1